VARRTLNLPDSVEELVRKSAEPGESFSAAASRLIVDGVELTRGKRPPSYVSSGEGPSDLGRKAETYLRDLVETR
jgi:hypothetical protein